MPQTHYARSKIRIDMTGLDMTKAKNQLRFRKAVAAITNSHIAENARHFVRKLGRSQLWDETAAGPGNLVVTKASDDELAERRRADSVRKAKAAEAVEQARKWEEHLRTSGHGDWQRKRWVDGHGLKIRVQPYTYRPRGMAKSKS